MRDTTAMKQQDSMREMPLGSECVDVTPEKIQSAICKKFILLSALIDKFTTSTAVGPFVVTGSHPPLASAEIKQKKSHWCASADVALAAQ